MKHLRIMTCLLLLGSMAPATALCTGKDAPKRSKEKGCLSLIHISEPTRP